MITSCLFYLLLLEAQALLDFITSNKPEKNWEHRLGIRIPFLGELLNVVDELLSMVLDVDLLEFECLPDFGETELPKLDNLLELGHVAHDVGVLHSGHLELLFRNTQFFHYTVVDINCDLLHFGEPIH
jgi:hypothetical protein